MGSQSASTGKCRAKVLNLPGNLWDCLLRYQARVPLRRLIYGACALPPKFGRIQKWNGGRIAHDVVTPSATFVAGPKFRAKIGYFSWRTARLIDHEKKSN